jgi:branched-chain amino acid transport system permease protein
MSGGGFFDLEFWTYIGVLAAIYTIFGLGVQLQYGIAGLFNFGQAAFMALGGYLTAILVVKTGIPTGLAIFCAIGVSSAFGVGLGLTTLRLRTDYLAMATIAAGTIVQYLANNLSITGGAIGTIGINGPTSVAIFTTGWNDFTAGIQKWFVSIFGSGTPSDLTMFVICWGVAAILIIAIGLMVRSPWGRVLKAVREDDVAVAALGKPAFRYRLQALAVGGGLVGAAGALYGLEVQSFSPADFLPVITFNAYVVVIVAGIGRVWPVFIGAVLFEILDAVTRFINVWPLNLLSDGDRAYLRFLIVGIALVALIMWRPQGLFGRKEEMIFER